MTAKSGAAGIKALPSTDGGNYVNPLLALAMGSIRFRYWTALTSLKARTIKKADLKA